MADDRQVGNLLVDLGELGYGAGLQPAVTVVVTAGLEQFGDLVESEPEPLRGL